MEFAKHFHKCFKAVAHNPVFGHMCTIFVHLCAFSHPNKTPRLITQVLAGLNPPQHHLDAKQNAARPPHNHWLEGCLSFLYLCLGGMTPSQSSSIYMYSRRGLNPFPHRLAALQDVPQWGAEWDANPALPYSTALPTELHPQVLFILSPKQILIPIYFTFLESNIANSAP